MLLFLIFALIVVSGLIAYLGDQIGMKVGKKRLSIFGIRPKYTSIIITILTGIFIATISITLLMIASEDVRMAVFDMNSLLAKLSYLDTQVQEKDKQLEEMEIDIASTTIELDNIRKERDILEEDLNKVKVNLEETQKEYSDLKGLLEETEEQYYDLARTKTELEKTTVQLETRIKDLEIEKKRLEGDKLALEKEIDVATQKINYLTINAFVSQLGDILFHKGDIVYMESLNTIPGGTEADATRAIEAFLDRANKHVYSLNLRENEIDGRKIRFENEEVLLKVAKQLINTDHEKILVSIFAAKNIWITEYLFATIEWQPNYRVFSKGEIIFQKVIDANQDPAVIQNEIAIILDGVSNLALERGLLGTSTGSVGAIEFSDFLKLFETIKQQSGKVMVTIQASTDVWRQNTLSTKNLQFKITPVGVHP